MHRWDGNVESVRGLAQLVTARCRSRSCPRRRRSSSARAAARTCWSRSRSGSQQRHRGRDEPADAALRPPLRRRGGQPLRPPAGRDHPLRGPQLPEPHRPHVRRDLPGLRGLVGGGRLGRALAVGELPLHDRGVPRVLRPPHARRRARRSCAGAEDVPRLVSNAVALLGAGGGAQARAGRHGEAGERRRPAADDLHAAQAPVHRGADGDRSWTLDGRDAGDRARPRGRGRLRRPALGPQDAWTQYVDEAAVRVGPGVRRPALLLRARRSRTACPAA